MMVMVIVMEMVMMMVMVMVMTMVVMVMTQSSKVFTNQCRDMKRREAALQRRREAFLSSRREPSISSRRESVSFSSWLEMPRRDARLASSFLTLAREDEVVFMAYMSIVSKFLGPWIIKDAWWEDWQFCNPIWARRSPIWGQ